MSPNEFYFASSNFLDLEMGVQESTRILIRKLQLSRSRSRGVGVHTSYTSQTATFQI